MRVKNAALAACAALAITLAQAAPALADQQVITNATTGTTAVTVQVEGNNVDPDTGELGNLTGNKRDETVLSFSVPTVIPFTVMPDGTMVGPSTNNTYIENLSVFGIHVSKLSVADQDPFKTVADTSGARNEENALSWRVGPEGREVLAADAKQGMSLQDRVWNMEYARDSGSEDRVYLATSGTASRITADIAKAKGMATITWTVAPGKVG